METLVVVAQHRELHEPARFGSSPPSRNFRGVNCRTFQSGAGLLPNPFKYTSIPLTKQPPSPKPSSPSDDGMCLTGKSSPIPINNNRTPRNVKSFNEEISDEGEGFHFSELWAGPAYSNSPPPSSLPVPKFLLRMKRTVSLDLPAADPVFDVHQSAKSTPASPTRELSPSAPSVAELFRNADSATKALRRILNLDNIDD